MSSFFLKLIAIITMTIDHFNVVIGYDGLLKLFPQASPGAICIITEIMSDIGRMAFPLFAFMIAEGCHRTKNIKKYIGRLVVFALISEPFFYFANNYKEATPFAGFLKNLAGFHLENVFFTLVIGVVAIYCYQILKEKYHKNAKFIFWPITLIAGFIAQYIDADYGILGVILIMTLYAAQTKTHQIIVVLLWCLGVYGLGSFAGTSFDLGQIQYALGVTIGAALSSVAIWFYNGNRGKKAKWIFYIYYPLHLFLLTMFGIFLLR